MKRILISLSIIAVVAAIVIGGTIAYFNDIETSTGNIFTAGSLDLKVDHTLAFYNNLFCQDDILVEQCDLGNLVQNGSFEFPEVVNSKKWDIFPSGTPGLDWMVEWRDSGPLQWHGYTRPTASLREYQEGAVGPAHEGDQLTELDSDWFGPNSNVNGEPASVKIYQYIPTVPGQKYALSFWYSPRPNIAANDNNFDVNWDGGLQQSFTPGSSSSMNWQQYTATVTASSYSTKLEFVDRGPANSLGVLLDDVSLVAIDCPGDNPLIGNSCASVFSETNLTDGDRYFNFEDVKPGDFGRDVISMHVYDNDSWACMIINHKDDEENTLTDPEAEAGDNTENLGELSKYLDIFAWRDDNDNGIYEPGSGETPIATGDLGNLENLSVYDSTTGTGVLPASKIKFIGLAWCAGTINVDNMTGAISCDGSTMGNDAQTDSFSADLTIFAEQWRNNSEFDCQNVKLGD